MSTKRKRPARRRRSFDARERELVGTATDHAIEKRNARQGFVTLEERERFHRNSVAIVKARRRTDERIDEPRVAAPRRCVGCWHQIQFCQCVPDELAGATDVSPTYVRRLSEEADRR